MKLLYKYFYDIDNFCVESKNHFKCYKIPCIGETTHYYLPLLSPSKIMTDCVLFSLSEYQTFK